MKKLKIALITEYLKPQVNGISVRFTEISKRIKETEHDLTVYGPKNHSVDHELITFKNHWNKDNFFCIPTFELLKKYREGKIRCNLHRSSSFFHLEYRCCSWKSCRIENRCKQSR